MISDKQILEAWNSSWIDTPDVKPEEGCPSCGGSLVERKVWDRACMANIVTFVCECGLVGRDPRPNYQAALLEFMCNQ